MQNIHPQAKLMHRPWLSSYPAGVPSDVDVNHYSSLVALMTESFKKYRKLPAYHFMGVDITYGETDELSQAFAVYLEELGLMQGDRVAIMMPNVPQYPVVVAAILRAGLVLVNVNPLYTPTELEYQLKDSGAKAIVILENFAHTLADCIDATKVQHVVCCALGDQLGWLKGGVVNWVVRHVKHLVPEYDLPDAVSFAEAIAIGKAGTFQERTILGDDLAVLQYTGGTTGVSKGAMLLHKNLVANILQSFAWNLPAMAKVPRGVPPVTVCALPMYHIYAFTVGMMLSMRMGGKLILIPNPRDLPAMFKVLSTQTVHSFPAVSTLLNAMLNHPDFDTVDWSHLKVTVGGGMAVQSSVAKLWFERTGCPVCEGYGLSETSPSVAGNPVTIQTFNGSIGIPLPNTYIQIIDDKGNPLPQGQVGEIAIKGPQVMAGYWQNPTETKNSITAQGYFKSGDIGIVNELGYIKIVDRKKDIILVSGFNVYPNEIEDVVCNMPEILECAAVGIPNEKTGDAVKLVLVRKDAVHLPVEAEDVLAFCKLHLTGYKRPTVVEFRLELPKTPVGKILRRALRASAV